MKKLISTMTLALCCSIAMSEEVTTPDSLAAILKKLNDQSYIVLRLEYEHKGYEAKVITPQGFLQEVKYDAAGNLSSTSFPHFLTMAEVLELVEKAGYRKISSIKISKNNTYAIEAHASDDEDVDITVDAKTGKIEVAEEWWDVF